MFDCTDAKKLKGSSLLLCSPEIERQNLVGEERSDFYVVLRHLHFYNF